jgi:hypothetical protein
VKLLVVEVFASHLVVALFVVVKLVEKKSFEVFVVMLYPVELIVIGELLVVTVELFVVLFEFAE